MLAKDLISEVVPPLKSTETGLHALNLMDIFRVSHLPIIDNSHFIGLISDEDIYDINIPSQAVKDHPRTLTSAYVYQGEHIYYVIELIHRNDMSLVPVLDDNDYYLGAITLRDLLKYFATITAVDNPGGIIILEMNMYDYSASEVTYIIEANDANVLSIYVNSLPDSTRVELTIKINKQDVSPIVQAFSRHEYYIKSYFSKENKLDKLNEDRFEEFMRYLNI